MIQSASLHTFEIDNPDFAIAEILDQLERKLTLKSNTVGIIQCDAEFIASGVVARICQALPFPVVGGTTLTQAVNDALGDLILTVLVLTADDVEFIEAVTENVRDDIFGATERSFQRAARRASMPLKMILVFPPILEEYAGDCYVQAFERLCGQIPIFGSLAVEMNITSYDRCATICNTTHYAHEMSYLLICGEIEPRFMIATVRENESLTATGVITRAEGNVALEINDMQAIRYFENIGLARDGELLKGVDLIPFIMRLEESEGSMGPSFVRALIRIDDRGGAVCRGEMHEGASFSIGSCEGGEIASAAQVMAKVVNDAENVHAVFFFSCIVRRLLCGVDPLAEARGVRQTLRTDIPFLWANSGGEICPAGNYPERAENRFHNYSLIACIL